MKSDACHEEEGGTVGGLALQPVCPVTDPDLAPSHVEGRGVLRHKLKLMMVPQQEPEIPVQS